MASDAPVDRGDTIIVGLMWLGGLMLIVIAGTVCGLAAGGIWQVSLGRRILAGLVFGLTVLWLIVVPFFPRRGEVQ